MEAAIRDLSTRIDRYSETSRDRAVEMSKEAQTGISDLNLRVAMLELRAKLWGGLQSGSRPAVLGTAIVQLADALVHAR